MVFKEREAGEVIFHSDWNKSPVSNGFNFSFFKNFWGLFKKEIMRLFLEFFEMTKLPSNFSPYFITLIPKISNPHLLPISG
jgi:hypothetical protein